MENITAILMKNLLNREVGRRVSTSYDLFPPEEVNETNEDGSYIEYTNCKLG